MSGVWGSLESQERVKSTGYALGIPPRRGAKEALPGLCVLSTVGHLLCVFKDSSCLCWAVGLGVVFSILYVALGQGEEEEAKNQA